jgi:hypothetical protein
MSGFEKLIQILEWRHYGDLIMAFFELTAIVTGLLFVRKQKTGIFFLGYLFFDLIALISIDYVLLSSFFTTQESSFFAFFTNTLISLVELIVYYHFFFKTIKSQFIIKLMKLLRIIFISIMIIFVTTQFSFLTNRFSYVTEIIGVIEFLFLLLPCFTYFYELFKNDPVVNLYHRPSFWIVTGIFFYAIISIPYYLIDCFFVNNQYEYRYILDLVLYYIPFAINFIFLTRAFLCKKTLTI